MSRTLVVLLLALDLSLAQIEASRQVTLTCGSDDVTSRGFPGAPGKRGVIGSKGDKGESGVKGDKGQSEETTEVIENLKRRITTLENQVLSNTQQISEEKENISDIETKIAELQNCSCEPIRLGGGLREVHNRSDCADVAGQGHSASETYSVRIGGSTVLVYCDLTNDGGRWTLIQRRIDGRLDFHRSWLEYVSGFGDKNHEFWLGLENIHRLTASKSYRLRVDLEDWNGRTAYAEYSSFSLEDSNQNYRIRVSGYTGTAGDALASNLPFTTKDRDNDSHSDNCASTAQYYGAWWYPSGCGYSNLNGLYGRDVSSNRGNRVVWARGRWASGWPPLMRTSMKIRPN